MLGLMQDYPLLTHNIIDHAALNHGEREIVTRAVEGPIRRSTLSDIRARSLRVAKALENEGVNFGDLRLSKRFKRLLTDIYDRCRNSIPAACGGWSETIAAYRFFDNKNVNLSDLDILSPLQ